MRATSKVLAAIVLLILSAGCSGDDDDDDDAGDVDAGVDANPSRWEVAQQNLPGALLSVWGTSPADIWSVGTTTSEGPLVVHYDGADWNRIDTSAAGEVDLWWVFGSGTPPVVPSDPVYFGGSGGTILSYVDGKITRMTTPDNVVTVFGIWGCSPTDVWAVGGQEGGQRGGFAWRLDGDQWIVAEGFPAEVVETDAVWKIFGRSCTDVWMVGTGGLAIHWDGKAFGPVERVAGNSLFTVHANSERFVAVGGFGNAVVVENDGSGWVDASPGSIDPAVGVCLTEDGGYASGWYGTMLTRASGEWAAEDTGITLDQTLHSTWVDPVGGVWAAGGQILSRPYGQGVLIHRAP